LLFVLRKISNSFLVLGRLSNFKYVVKICKTF
jgi:hypothetical protein